MLAWVVENAVQRLSSNPSQANTILRHMLGATLLAAEISMRMPTRFSAHIQRAKRRVTSKEDNKSLLKHLNRGRRL
jgi:hypothetical protein